MDTNDSTSVYIQLQFDFDVQEIWLPIAGYEDLYEVSNLGRVKRILSRRNAKAGAILNAKPVGQGYPQVVLCKDGTKWTVRIHILVMQMFVGTCPKGMEVNHTKGIKTDNRLSQLEYVTHSQNVHHRYDVLGHKGLYGEANPNTKLKEIDVITIRSEVSKGNISQSELARLYKVSWKTIRNIVNRVTWAHI